MIVVVGQTKCCIHAVLKLLLLRTGEKTKSQLNQDSCDNLLPNDIQNLANLWFAKFFSLFPFL